MQIKLLFFKQKRYMPDRTLTTWKGLMKIYFKQDTYFLSTPCRSLEIKLHLIHVHIHGKKYSINTQNKHLKISIKINSSSSLLYQRQKTCKVRDNPVVTTFNLKHQQRYIPNTCQTVN